jgi:hypothetical protein
MTERDRAESLVQDAEMQGFTRKQSVEIAMYGVDKIIKIHDPVYKYSDYFTNDLHSQMF